MEWLIAILTIVFTPILTLLGIIITEKYKYRSKKMELDTTKEEFIHENIHQCQIQHKDDVEKVRAEFNDRLDDLLKKLDEIQTEQLRTTLYVTQLQNDVQKHNSVIERTFRLESDVAVLKEKLANG